MQGIFESPFRQECLRVLCPHYTWIPQEDRHKCLKFIDCPSGIEKCCFICNGQNHFIVNIYYPTVKKMQWILFDETAQILATADTLEELMDYFKKEILQWKKDTYTSF